MKCEFGVVKKVWLSEDWVVLIHNPAWTETARKIQEELEEKGIEVVRLNTGVDSEADEARKLLELCFQTAE